MSGRLQGAAAATLLGDADGQKQADTPAEGGARTAEASITEAKACFAALVRHAESGIPVHITRRGRRVAVLVSDAKFAGLKSARAGGLMAYTQQWRAEAARAGLEFWSDADWTDLRDQGERPASDLD